MLETIHLNKPLFSVESLIAFIKISQKYANRVTYFHLFPPQIKHTKLVDLFFICRIIFSSKRLKRLENVLS